MKLRVNRQTGAVSRELNFSAKYFRSSYFLAMIACLVLLAPVGMLADPVVVHHAEGMAHGFLVLQTLDGNVIADGDMIQLAKGNRMTVHLTFHFKDGSLYEDTFAFTQRGTFRLLSDHLVEKGPAFKQQLDTSLDATTGKVTTNYTDSDGKEKSDTDQMKLPPDLSNGMMPILLKNLQPGTDKTTVSMVVATPKPRLVKLIVTPVGEESFTVGGGSRKAEHYSVKIDLGGPAAVLAPIFGKEPPDTNVWIVGGEAPLFLKSEGPLFNGGPIWRIAPVFPAWPQGAAK
jgi:hypothetical protein